MVSSQKENRRSAGLRYGLKNRCGLNAFPRSVPELQSRWAGLLASRTPSLRLLKSSNSKSHHSGATARDSHPLPYSPHLLGHPDAFKYKEQFLWLICADTITRLRALSNTRPSLRQRVLEDHLVHCFGDGRPVRFIEFQPGETPTND